LAHWFADCGITCPQAERLLRAVCVREAAEAEVKARKKPNFSRIALSTGLDRKEVARLLRRPLRIESQLETRPHPGDQVLEGWYADQTFAVKGRPLTLSIKAPRRGLPSFWSLANRYAPDVYPGLILRELLRIGAVETLYDGRVRALTRRIENSPRRRKALRAHLDSVLRSLVPRARRRRQKSRQPTRRPQEALIEAPPVRLSRSGKRR